ncbi:uncharacterized protein BDW70DRAFT_165177 [Aspergillus foveolatus]|uniref:uncharacterized protein n=1 Tax=Aspergillus foveolatus TaxID=210207 RepID=UPI003CCC9C9D
MPTDLFPEVMRTDLFSYEAAIPMLYIDVAETLFRTRLRAWPTTKIQAIACDIAGLDPDIALAVKEGLKKYKKYYIFMDESDTYYTALVLDPRVKGGLIMEELQDNNAGNLILQAIQSNLHDRYPPKDTQQDLVIAAQQYPIEDGDVEARMLQKLQPRSQPLLSDIDRYFDSPLVSVTDTKDPNWLCNWWRIVKIGKSSKSSTALPLSPRVAAVDNRIFNLGNPFGQVRVKDRCFAGGY